jgi:DNA-binding NarL/FixJ family response regulator
MTTLLVVEDNATFANIVIQFLSRFDNYAVVAVVGSAEEALAQLPNLTVDLALLDVSLPRISGIELAAAIRKQYPELRCIMFSGHHEHVYVQQALAAGAQGYVLKENPLDLVAAIRAVLAGETYLSAKLQA